MIRSEILFLVLIIYYKTNNSSSSVDSHLNEWFKKRKLKTIYCHLSVLMIVLFHGTVCKAFQTISRKTSSTEPKCLHLRCICLPSIRRNPALGVLRLQDIH